ncbi:DNA topoisomerase IV alpha subunit [Venturia nashicola]|nr:DNA topoisomerase IV alpha subunit [Venturia nashicola]
MDSSSGVRDRVETIFEQQLDAISSDDEHLSVTVKTRAVSRPSTSVSDSVGDAAPRTRTFQFPGKHEKEAWRYTVVIRILELIHDALINDVVITKRDPALFSKQAVVDRYVDDLACTFGVPRALLNVTATAKGLVAGAFVINRRDGSRAEGWSEREGTLVSPLSTDETVDVDRVKWILVVEKEATFRSLVSSSLWASLASHGILITAKGYPDIATRSLLRSLAMPSSLNRMKKCSLYGLMDFDPDGLDILSTYKHGSKALAHQSAELVLPSIQWIGVKGSHVGQEDDLHQTQGLLKLSARDRRKATSMLEREQSAEGGTEPEWRRELQVMLMLNVKAEIQLLEARTDGLVGYLKNLGIS